VLFINDTAVKWVVIHTVLFFLTCFIISP